VVETEVARLSHPSPSSWARPATSRTLLVAGMVESARWLRGHEPLTYLLEYEPGAVLPSVTFGRLRPGDAGRSDLAAPFFARWLEPEQASRAAEWAVRIVMAYTSDPSPYADLTDPADTRALVRTFVLPGILALRLEVAGESPGLSSTSHSTSIPGSTSNRATIKGAAQ